jgi:hypothetical protein
MNGPRVPVGLFQRARFGRSLSAGWIDLPCLNEIICESLLVGTVVLVFFDKIAIYQPQTFPFTNF